LVFWSDGKGDGSDAISFVTGGPAIRRRKVEVLRQHELSEEGTQYLLG